MVFVISFKDIFFRQKSETRFYTSGQKVRGIPEHNHGFIENVVNLAIFESFDSLLKFLVDK